MKTLGKNPSLAPICLKVIGNLLTGDNGDIDELINYGVIELLESFLDSPHILQQKESVWALSNIAAGSKNNIERLIPTRALTKVIEKIKNLTKINLEVLLECVWTIANTVSGCDIELSIKLLEMDILQTFIHILDKVENDIILLVALNGLNSLFKIGEPMKQLICGDGNIKNPIVDRFCYFGGHVQLEKLLNHKIIEVYNKTDEIVRQYFNFEDYEVIENTYNNDIDNNNKNSIQNNSS